MVTTSDTGKPTVAVCVHLYDCSRVHCLMRCAARYLASDLCDASLFVTVSGECSQNIKETVSANYPEAHILEVENRGYDVGPFFQCISKFDLCSKDIVVKLYAKDCRIGIHANVCGTMMSRRAWQRLLVKPLAGCANDIENCLRAFHDDGQVGMVGSCYLLHPISAWRSCWDNEHCRSVLDKLGLEMKDDAQFVAGTMFAVRGSLLKILKDSGALNQEFDLTFSGKKGNSLAHAYEAALGAIVAAQGFRYLGVGRTFWRSVLGSNVFGLFMKALFQRRKTSHGKNLIRILGIPVWAASDRSAKWLATDPHVLYSQRMPRERYGSVACA